MTIGSEVDHGLDDPVTVTGDQVEGSRTVRQRKTVGDHELRGITAGGHAVRSIERRRHAARTLARLLVRLARKYVNLAT